MLDKSECIYADYVNVEHQHAKLWLRLRSLPKCKSVTFMLEGSSRRSVNKRTNFIDKMCSRRAITNNGQHLKTFSSTLYMLRSVFIWLFYLWLCDCPKWTKDASESVERIIRCARTLADHRFKQVKMNPLSVVNQKIVTQEIQGVSEKMAKAVVNKYKYTGNLMRVYLSGNLEQGKQLLTILKRSSSGNSSNRLGPRFQPGYINILCANWKRVRPVQFFYKRQLFFAFAFWFGSWLLLLSSRTS